MKLWTHQDRALAESRRAFQAGERRWCLVAPCGAGKSLIMQRIAIPAAAAGLRVALYAHRVLLTTQLVEGFEKVGHEDFGVIASGWPKEYERPEASIQICSLQTVNARIDSHKFDFPPADILIVDEAHQQTGDMAKTVFRRHFDNGLKAKIGFTATPVDIGGHYDKLVSAGTYPEMIGCGAHLPIRCYGPDRPDLDGIRTSSGGSFSQSDDQRINRVPTIFGSVYDNWKRLNPSALPAIGFAPGVPEARGFVEEFYKKGVACGCIDSGRVIICEKRNGKMVLEDYPADDSSRHALLLGSKTGDLKILWNRFVLREAVDMPWLYHAIAATSMGSVSTWIQSIGRVQRFYPDYDHVLLQDHGGNIDRHGPPDIERDWSLGCTNNSVHKKETEARQAEKGPDAEPICCPKCNAYRLSGPKCDECGHIHKMSSRMVRQIDGTLVRKLGRHVKHKAPKAYDDFIRSAIYAGFFNGATVKQAFNQAGARARKAGVPMRPGGKVYILPKNDPRWHHSVRDVYPTYRPRSLPRK